MAWEEDPFWIIYMVSYNGMATFNQCTYLLVYAYASSESGYA